MVLVIYLIISTHEPDARMIVVTFCCVAVIPLPVQLYKEPEVDIAVTGRRTVDPHVRNACSIQEHLAACIVNIAVTVMQRESSVSRVLIIRCSRKEPEPECVVDPVEYRSCGLDIAVFADVGKHLRSKCVRITVSYMISTVVSA